MNPKERYLKLEQHLSEENPVLLQIINSFRELDRVGYKTGLLKKDESYASNISWWPLISVLGTFSAGKSTFINSYTGQDIQSTGNQAIDDKFTVVCYGNNPEITTLPGLALDSDPRFPFFGISQEIEKVETGQGSHIDQYLQLKTTHTDALKGKILIDSPGFDADSQRDSTLRLTNHIIDMSDLVLVFFDARHPEPGAMRDTLEHLVSTTIARTDSDKVLYILNQIDTAAKEDNPEEVIGSWQRAISSQGLVGGNFYAIYNEDSANDIDDEALAGRFKRKKDVDMKRIFDRMDGVSTERTYRIANSLEKIAQEIETQKIPRVQKAVRSWRNKVYAADVVIFGGLIAAIVYGLQFFGYFDMSVFDWPLVKIMQQSIVNGVVVSVMALLAIFGIHWLLRSKIAKWDAGRLMKKDPQIATALLHNNRFWRGMSHNKPRGWSGRNRMALERVVDASKNAIQKLNDQFVNPTGKPSITAEPVITNEKVIDADDKPAHEAEVINPSTAKA